MFRESFGPFFQAPATWGSWPDANGIGPGWATPNAAIFMKMYIKVNGGVIEDVKFKTFGCGAAIATSSMATEMVKGQSIDDAP